MNVPSTFRLADVLEFATWYVYSPISCGLVISITRLLIVPFCSHLTLSLKSTGCPFLSHFPSADALATSHSNTAVWDSATVKSQSGLLMAPPKKKESYYLYPCSYLNIMQTASTKLETQLTNGL